MKDKDAKLLKEAYTSIYESSWEDTYWKDIVDGQEITVTIKDLLNNPSVKNEPVRKLSTDDVKDLIVGSVEDDPERVQRADLQYPIIVTTVDGQYKEILDGNHRLKKAVKNELPTIKAKVVEVTSLPLEWQAIFT